MFSPMGQTNPENFGNGGTIDGDLVVTGDLQVSGGGSLSFDEIIEGTQVIDVDSTEALLVRKNGDGGDVFTVDTSNMDVTVNGAKNTTTFSVTNNWSTTNDYIKIALNDATIRSTVLDSGARNLILAPLGNDALTLHSTSGGVITANIGGALGVGTSSPTNQGSALHIYQNHASNNTFLTVESDGANASAYIDIDTAADRDGFIRFKEAGTDKASIFNDSSADSLVLTDGANSNTVFIKANKLGIGNDSPATALDIKGTDNTSSKITITNTSGTDNIWSIHANYNTQALAFTGDSAEVMTLLDTGKVGINVSDPSEELEVKASGDSCIAINTSTATNDAQLKFFTGDSEDWIIYCDGSATNDPLMFYDSASTSVMMTLDNGKVGIGISPLATFHAKMASNVNFTTTANSSSLRLNAVNDAVDATIPLEVNSTSTYFLTDVNIGTTATYGNLTIGGTGEIIAGRASSGAGSFSMYEAGTTRFVIESLNGSNGMAFKIPSTEAMRIDSNGNIGIGENSPDTRLHVKETIDVAYSVDNFTTDANALLKLENSSGTDTAFASIAFRTDDGCDIYIGSMNKSGASNDGSFIVANQNSTDIQFLVLDNNSRISLSNNDGGGTGGQNSTSSNTIIGYNAGNAVTSGTINNTFIGHNAGLVADGAVANVVVGTNSADALTTGDHNVALGYFALSASTDVDSVVAIGSGAMESGNVTSGADGNVAIGRNSLLSLVSGGSNVAVGAYSLDACNTGSQNTAVGESALSSTDDGVSNVAIGNSAIGLGNCGTANVAIGSQSMVDLTGSYNTAVGMQSAFDLTSGGSNVAVGALAMKFSNGGESDNVALGVQAMQDVKENGNTADSNIAIGTQAMKGGTLGGDFIGNIAIGRFSMDATDTNAQTGTIAIGHQSLTALTSGIENTAIGYQSADGLTTGGYNTFVGYKVASTGTITGQENTAMGNTALGALTSGSQNTALGVRAGLVMATGSANVFIGKDAGDSASACSNVIAIGHNAMHTVTDSTAVNGTIAIGESALDALTSGERNTAVGFESLKSNTIGDKNTAVGYQALESFNADTDAHGHNTAVGHNAMQGNATGTDNTAIGNQSAFSGTNNMTSGDNNTFIGSQTSPSSATPTNQTVIGKGATGQADNSVTLGNASVTDVYMAQDKGATVHADYVLSQGNQNHVANTMSSPYYRFDGTDDSINCTAISGMNNFSLVAWAKAPDWDDNNHHNLICSYNTGANSDWYRISILNDGTITFSVDSGDDDSGLVQAKYTHSLTDETWHHIVGVCDQENNLLYLYVDGVNVVNATYNDNTSIDVSNLRIGSRGDSASAENWKGEIGAAQVWNKALTASEVKSLYSGASVPYKYKFGGEKITASGDRVPSGSVGNWVFNGTSGGNVAWDSTLSAIKVTSGGSGTVTARGHLATSNLTTFKEGQVFEITAEVYIPSSNGTWTGLAVRQSDMGGGSTTVNNTTANVSTKDSWQSLKSTVTLGSDVTGSIEIDGDTTSGSGQIFYFRNISVQIKGCVAEYDGSGIASDKWFDKSGNDNHGAVSGAIIENAPAGDDGLVYEEGTHTVTISGATSGSYGLDSTNDVLRYTRIGNLVTIQGLILITSDSSASGQLRISLPYTILDQTGLSGRSYGSAYLTAHGGTIAGRVYAKLEENNAFFTLVEVADNGTDNDISDSDVDGAFNIGVNFSYTV